MKSVLFLFFFLGIYFISSFSTHRFIKIKSIKENTEDTLRYIFLGHVYNYQSSPIPHRLDPKIERLDYTKYNRIWPGGDISSEASLDFSTMKYLDSVFDLASPRVQYAVGNHDIRNGNIQYYKRVTKRKSYNFFSENGVVSICINSQLNPSQCEDLNLQFNLIKNVCDTIQKSKHLVLLMHSCLFCGVPGLPNPGNYAHVDFQYWNANCQDASQTFSSSIYPMLTAVRNRGVEVHVIMGDTGVNRKGFHQETPEAIHFYASGISNSKYIDALDLLEQPPDKVLVFEHEIKNQKMKWSFQNLDSLINE